MDKQANRSAVPNPCLAMCGAMLAMLGVSCGAAQEPSSDFEHSADALLIHATATASSTEHSSHGPGNAVDGNSSTRWSSAFSDPQWLQLDFGSVQPIARVTLHWEAA